MLLTERLILPMHLQEIDIFICSKTQSKLISCILIVLQKLPEVELSQSKLWVVSGPMVVRVRYFVLGEDQLLPLGPE